MRVSLVICTRKRSLMLKTCLESIKSQTRIPDEVVVVSSGSLGQDRKAISRFPGLPIKHFLEPRKGIPQARNRGLKEARGEIIVFVDDDCRLDREHLQKVVLAHQQFPQAAAIQGQSLNGRPKNIFARMLYFYYQAWFKAGFGGKKERETTLLDTKNISFKKNLIKNLQFNSFFTPYLCGEDVDFGWRLLKRGLKIIYEPGIRVWHQERADLIGFLKSRYKQGRVSLALIKIWPEKKIIRQDRERWLFLIRFLKKIPLGLGYFLLGKIAYELGRFKERIIIDRQVEVSGPGQVKILHLAIDRLTTDQVLEKVERVINQKTPPRKPLLIFTPNVDHLMLLREDKEFQQAYQQADLVVADGMPLVWASWFLKHSLPERVNGTNLAEKIIALATQGDWSIGLVGSSQKTILQASKNLLKMFPGLRVDQFSKLKKVDVLLACHGAPKQEKWLGKNPDQLRARVALGVGSAIEFWSGNLKRAPVWMQKVGLEWLFRLIKEPKRLWRRYLVRDVKFPFLLFKQVLLSGKKAECPLTLKN